VACDPGVAANGDGHHNAGQSCITAGCHDGNTAEAPLWTAAGTVYDALGGGAAVAGATIHLVDGAGTDVKLVTSANGNFYTAQAITYPVTTRVSKCPTTIPMVAQVQANGASCNTAGCHVDGNRVHVP
jgi:hypothetical protein